MDWTLEVVVVPVASRNGGVDRAIAFYRDQLGFGLDHHTRAAGTNFAQLTPRGSGCSIVIGELPGGPDATGLAQGSATCRRRRLPRPRRTARSRRAAGEINVTDERDGGTLFEFDDPDGNTWIVQQIKARADQP